MDARNAERVAGHLVVAGTLVDEDPELALAHARAARDRASRVAVVREAVGVAAYHAGDYAEAARELRAYRRMSGDDGYRAVLADCERALGRPEVALRLVAEALRDAPDEDEAAELHLVEAGARRDLDEAAAARLVLEAALGGRPRPGDLRPEETARIRLATAYADLLEEEGVTEAAAEWRAALAAVDPDREEADEAFGVEFAEVLIHDEDVDDGDGEDPDDADEHVRDADAEEDEAAGGAASGDRFGLGSRSSSVPSRESAAPEPDDPTEGRAADGAVAGSDEVGEDADLGGDPDFAADVEAEVAELLGETDGAGPVHDVAPEGAEPSGTEGDVPTDRPGEDAQH